MHKRLINILPVLPALLVLIYASACSQSASRGNAGSDSAEYADSMAQMMREANDMTSEAYSYADSILSGLTLERKAAMLLMPATFSRSDASTMKMIHSYVAELGVGGLVLLKGTLADASIIIDSVYNMAPEGILIAVDAENGLKMRFEDAPEFPWNRELGRLSDDQLMYEFGREIARECKAVGINMVLGPVMDIVPGENYHGIMRKRSLGSNPKVVAELAIAYSKGIEDGNVMSVAKHFPGHGSSNADSHKALGEVNSPLSQIDSIDLYPFRRYAREGLSGIMVGHLAVSALDSVRRPAVVSPVIMQDILRGRLGFKGIVITDAINMDGAKGIKAWQAIAAGADMVIAPARTEDEIRAIVVAVESGNLSEEVIDDRCRRILFHRYLTGVNRRPPHQSPEEIRSHVNRFAPLLRDSLRKALAH